MIGFGRQCAGKLSVTLARGPGPNSIETRSDKRCAQKYRVDGPMERSAVVIDRESKCHAQGRRPAVRVGVPRLAFMQRKYRFPRRIRRYVEYYM